MKKRKILFLGESYRADAITWTNGLREFGDFEIIGWELKTETNTPFNKLKRILEYTFAIFKIKRIIKQHQPDMVIAERTTSYGFLAALSKVKPMAIAQQGRTDLWPENSLLVPFKKILQNYAFKKATLIHAWGPVMEVSMSKANVNMDKVLVLPKGIDLTKFTSTDSTNPTQISAIVTRSLMPEYRHDIILKAFAILNNEGIDFTLTIVGEGTQRGVLMSLAKKLNIENKVHFTGRIPNTELPKLLQASSFYISMPITEGVSASLFEAMASNCYPIVTDILGNQSWIKHRKNGQLIALNDSKMLAEELLWSFKNKTQRDEAVLLNRKFIEKNIDYKINMKIIANKYHELINANSSIN
jgi:glycosyltransferase involved in cell wall biosynthesis